MMFNKLKILKLIRCEFLHSTLQTKPYPYGNNVGTYDRPHTLNRNYIQASNNINLEYNPRFNDDFNNSLGNSNVKRVVNGSDVYGGILERVNPDIDAVTGGPIPTVFADMKAKEYIKPKENLMEALKKKKEADLFRQGLDIEKTEDRDYPNYKPCDFRRDLNGNKINTKKGEHLTTGFDISSNNCYQGPSVDSDDFLSKFEEDYQNSMKEEDKNEEKRKPILRNLTKPSGQNFNVDPLSYKSNEPNLSDMELIRGLY